MPEIIWIFDPLKRADRCFPVLALSSAFCYDTIRKDGMIMAKICTTEKTARRQEWIEAGLLELMQQKRFEDITVTDLCSRLKLARRSFYRYFQDLEDVLDSALNHVFQKMAISGSFPDPEEIRKNYVFWLEHRAVLDALHNSGMTDKLFDYVTRFTDSLVWKTAPEQALQQDIRLFATTGSLALILSWHRDGFSRTPEEMSQISYRMLYEPLLRA